MFGNSFIKVIPEDGWQLRAIEGISILVLEAACHRIYYRIPALLKEGEVKPKESSDGI